MPMPFLSPYVFLRLSLRMNEKDANGKKRKGYERWREKTEFEEQTTGEQW